MYTILGCEMSVGWNRNKINLILFPSDFEIICKYTHFFYKNALTFEVS